jgi:orotate phosphoribosyltransferase
MARRQLREFDCDAIISPALGGIIVGQEVARSLGKRHIFVEKEDGKLVLRRGFQIAPDEKFIVVEDVVTRGGRVQETIDIVRAHDGVVSAVGVILDRSWPGQTGFWLSLRQLNRNERGNLPRRQVAARPCENPRRQTRQQIGGGELRPTKERCCRLCCA